MPNMLFFLLHTQPIPPEILIPTSKPRNPCLPVRITVPKRTEYSSNLVRKPRVHLQSDKAQIRGQIMVTFFYFWSHTQSRHPILHSSLERSKASLASLLTKICCLKLLQSMHIINDLRYPANSNIGSHLKKQHFSEDQ